MSKMDRLISLRDALASDEGKTILDECHRYMVEVAGRSNADAEWIKGMGMMLGRLLNIEEECRNLHDEMLN